MKADYKSEVVSMNAERGFWGSAFGITIRWASFIPIGLITVEIIKTLAIAFFGWMMEDGKFFVIFLFIGGISSIFMTVGLIYLAARLTEAICPRPKFGMIIFSTILAIIEILTIYGTVRAYMLDSFNLKILIVSIIASITTIAVTAITTASIQEERGI